MPTSSEQPSKEVHTEVGILNKLISIPAEPITVKWEINESKETGSLRALLKFKDEDKLHILKNSASFDKLENDTLDSESCEQWLPEDAKVGIETKKNGSAYTLIDVIAIQPNLFTQTELSPYVNGSITPLSGGYILVSLYSM